MQDGVAQHRFVHLEVRSQALDELEDLPRGHVDDEVDVVGGTRARQHRAVTWRESKWWQIFSCHEEIKYSCSNYMDSSYWSDTLRVPFNVTCIMR